MKYFLTVLALTLTLAGFSQKFKGSIFTGLTASQVDGDTYSGFNRAGLNAGVGVAFPFSEKIAGQFEIKFTQKGSYRGQRPNIGDYSTYSIKLNYIELPLIVKYLYKPKINFETGLAFGYLMSSKEEFNDLTDPGSRPFYKNEFSWLIGGNYQLYKNISVNIRYSYSVLPIRKNLGNWTSWYKRGQFNNVVCFSFYYKLGNSDGQ